MKHKRTELAFSQLYDGFMMSIAQGCALLEEAMLMYRHRRFQGACSKLVLALEEIGKNRILLYQAGLPEIGKPQDWNKFWRAFYSHTRKLKVALQWARAKSDFPTSTLDEERELLADIHEYAITLDKDKQASQYTDFDGQVFTRPHNHTVRESVRELMRLTHHICHYLRSEHPITYTEEQFRKKVMRVAQLSQALGYTDTNTEDELLTAWVDSYTPIYTEGGQLPDDTVFWDRLRERYTEVPKRIKYTIARLCESKIFHRFLSDIVQQKGYPEWIIVSVLYNIALNEKINTSEFTCVEEAIAFGINWHELPNDPSIPVSIFCDIENFEKVLDLWMLSFLSGMGIAVDVGEATNLRRVRRLAQHHYAILSRDVPHNPIFVRNDTPNAQD